MNASRPRILLVDDYADTRDSSSAALELEGFEVLTSPTAMHAMVTVNDEPLDAVVVDLALPYINGLQLMEELRTVQPHLVVTAFSGHTDMRSKAEKAGAAAFFPKPCDFGVMASTLRTLIAARAAQ